MTQINRNLWLNPKNLVNLSTSTNVSDKPLTVVIDKKPVAWGKTKRVCAFSYFSVSSFSLEQRSCLLGGFCLFASNLVNLVGNAGADPAVKYFDLRSLLEVD